MFEYGRVRFHVRTEQDLEHRSHHMTLSDAQTPESFKHRVTELLLLEDFANSCRTVVANIDWRARPRAIPLRTYGNHHAVMMEV